jgi:hypothetical protein
MANRTFEKLRASGKRCGRSNPYTIISAIARDFRIWPLRLNLIDSRERGFSTFRLGVKLRSNEPESLP